LGAIPLANAVIKACTSMSSNSNHSIQFLYDINESIEKKIETIAKEMYGADGISISDIAKEKIKVYEREVKAKLIFLKRFFFFGVFIYGFIRI